ncbi:hypothetical protein HX001_00270 [Empedobacter brevis]|uniref:Uncharacterized protein n=1 Tax=Empedobacter brevis TaxID=247 RepID=A0AAJ1QBF9_9FLAO|nr:hypothetical protein [Empedobacter brevis]MDM1070920.1 hypothetical protein [Empedobacter brevis]QHC85116.1 hypothetical protein AS589_10190 [Empedobacter brevis]
MKFFILFTIVFGCLQSNAQVGINTSTPNDATILDIVSNNKGILIPRLTTTERNSSLADNDPLTIPPNGVSNTSLTAGTLIFNLTDNRFEFWDGLVWRQLFVPTSSTAGNDGVVKINGGAGGAKPSVSLTPNGNTYGTPHQILYTTPLTFAPSPTTSWPETTVPFPGVTSNIYIGANAAAQRWRENEINGQVHIWRLIATVTAGSNSSGSLKATFKNPDSGFEINSISLLPAGSSGLPKVLTFYFYTIADPESLAANRGYQLFLESDTSCTFVADSFTRISLFKD